MFLFYLFTVCCQSCTTTIDIWYSNVVCFLGGYWIGGHDIEVEGQFKWVNSGNELVYTNWGRNQPGNASVTENCISIHYFNHKWFDDECSASHYYLCEIK